MYLKMRNRAYELFLIVRMIDKINNEIRYSRSPVEDIFLSLCTGSTFEKLGFPARCKENMTAMPFPLAFKTAAEQSRGSLSLNSEDFYLLCAFFEELGTTDSEGQLKNCQSYKMIFEDRSAAALSARNQKGKMYCSVFFLAALGVLVVLL